MTHQMSGLKPGHSLYWVPEQRNSLWGTSQNTQTRINLAKSISQISPTGNRTSDFLRQRAQNKPLCHRRRRNFSFILNCRSIADIVLTYLCFIVRCTLTLHDNLTYAYTISIVRDRCLHVHCATKYPKSKMFLSLSVHFHFIPFRNQNFIIFVKFLSFFRDNSTLVKEDKKNNLTPTHGPSQPNDIHWNLWFTYTWLIALS